DRAVAHAHVVAQLVEGLAGARLGDLHAGAVVGEPGGVVAQLLGLGAAGHRLGQGAVAPAPAVRHAAADAILRFVADAQVDIVEAAAAQPHAPATSRGIGHVAGLSVAIAARARVAVANNSS